MYMVLAFEHYIAAWRYAIIFCQQFSVRVTYFQYAVDIPEAQVEFPVFIIQLKTVEVGFGDVGARW